MVANVSTPATKSKKQRNYPDRDLKLLFGGSAGRCAFPNCRDKCIEPGTALSSAVLTGIIAHIQAHSDKGPRANPALAIKERDCYENWVLLCSKHHIIVDGQPETYTSDLLLQWKAELEQWVEDQLRVIVPQITHAEIRHVCSAVLQAPAKPSDSFDLTPTVEKMRKNGLTARTQKTVQIGAALHNDIADVIQKMTVVDAQFSERLRAAFVNEYNTFYEKGHRGDSLFEALLDFVTGVSPDLIDRCAAVGVLAYMFVMCEVFEK